MGQVQLLALLQIISTFFACPNGFFICVDISNIEVLIRT